MLQIHNCAYYSPQEQHIASFLRLPLALQDKGMSVSYLVASDIKWLIWGLGLHRCFIVL